MTEYHYLANGQLCFLKEKLGDKFVVNKIFQTWDGENYPETVIDPADTIVDQVFDKPPVEMFAEEIAQFRHERNELDKEIRGLIAQKRKFESEIENLKKTEISNEKFIINKTDILNAKSLALFPRDEVMPMLRDVEDGSFNGLKVRFEISLKRNEEKVWGYKLYNDGEYFDRFLCPKYGILINPTQEQIDEVIVKRLKEFEFKDYALVDVDDKYLTPELLERKRNYVKGLRDKELKRKEDDLERLKKEIEELKAA